MCPLNLSDLVRLSWYYIIDFRISTVAMPRTNRIIGVLIDPRFSFGRNVWYGSGHYVQQMARPWQFRGVRYGTPDGDAVDYLKACGVDGVIAHVTSPSMVRPLEKLGVPVVSTAGGVKDLPFPRVNTDDIEVGHMAADYFANHGFRRFAYVGTTEEYAVHRGVGFRTTLVKAGYDCQSFEPTRVTSKTLKEHTSADELTAPTRAWRGLIPNIRAQN